MPFIEELGIEYISANATRVEAIMPITPSIHQPYGFVHGGATLSLLETVASQGALYYADLAVERPFGIAIEVRHRKSAQMGTLRGVAELDHVEGRKQFWRIAAYDDDGDIISEGSFVTKVVTIERLREKGIAVPKLTYQSVQM